MKIALILGSTGSVGNEVTKALVQNKSFDKVIVFLRKPLKESSLSRLDKIVQKIVPDMNESTLAASVSLTLEELSQTTPVELFGFSALGVGANTAKLTIDQHRAIDVKLNQAFAKCLRQSSHVKYFAFLSAFGANPHAKTTGSGAAGMPRYARVKGEAEEAVKREGPTHLGIFRPAMIRGSQHTPKILEWGSPVFDLLVPKKFHSISTRQIALAMVGASLKSPPPSGVFHYPEMMELIKG